MSRNRVLLNEDFRMKNEESDWINQLPPPLRGYFLYKHRESSELRGAGLNKANN